jgi:ATP-binding protein involved in chromosome partitioning
MAKLPLKKENILKALSNIYDPDLKKDIVALNFVQDLEINGKDVKFSLVLTTPSCPVRDQFVKESKRVIYEQIEGVGAISVNLSSKVTSTSFVSEENLIPGVKNTIAVASGKGGVGKSTVAVNLAVALALDGAKVGLVDADVYGPSIPLMFGINDKPVVQNEKLIPLMKYGVKIMSIGFLVDPMQALIWRGPMASGAVRQFMSDVEWGDLDYLIFDMPPGTGDIQLTLVQTIPLSGAVIVTTPQPIALADAKKGLMMFNKVNVPILGIVENMSYYACSHCGERDYIFAKGGGRITADELKAPFLGEIPIATMIRVGGDNGVPIVIGEPDLPQAKVLREIARNLAARISMANADKRKSSNVEIVL